MIEPHIQVTFKLIVVGSQNVGKTNILNRYTTCVYNEYQRPTVGIQFSSKILKVQDKLVQVNIWDTAGQERYRCMAPMFYKGAQGALVVFSLDDRQSYSDIHKWVRQVRDSAQDGVVIIILGNKCDLEQKEISREQGQKLAHQCDCMYLQVSAAQNLNVEAAFQHVIDNIYLKKRPVTEAKTKKGTKLSSISLGQKNTPKQPKPCC